MPQVDRDLLVKILQDLVRIPSVNPDLVPGAEGEAAVSKYICDLMRSWGLEAIDTDLAPSRHNAVGILHGTGGGRTLLFNGHMDTVSVEGMTMPFSADVRGGAATSFSRTWPTKSMPALARKELWQTSSADGCAAPMRQ